MLSVADGSERVNVASFGEEQPEPIVILSKTVGEIHAKIKHHLRKNQCK